MKITVRVNEFKRLLEEASFVMVGKPAIPHDEFVKVEVSGTRASMTAASVGAQIVQHFELVNSDEDGAFLIHPEKTQRFLKKHIDGTATIAYSDGQVTIAVGVGGFTLQLSNESREIRRGLLRVNVVKVGDYRDTSKMPEKSQEINLKILKRLCEQVKPAVPDKDGKQVTSSLKLEGDGAILRAIGTDGYRIAIAESPSNVVLDLKIPKSFLPILKRRQGAKARIAESETQSFLHTDSCMVSVSKPISRFPPWKNVVSDFNWKTKLRLSSEDLKNTLASVTSAVDAKKPSVFLSLNDDLLDISAEQNDSNDRAAGSMRVTVETVGEQSVVRLNPSFVNDFLSQVSGEISLRWIDGEKFVEFGDGQGYRTLIFPLKRPKQPSSEVQAISSVAEK